MFVKELADKSHKNTVRINDHLGNRIITALGHAAFKFDRRVHFAFRRKILKPPVASLSAI